MRCKKCNSEVNENQIYADCECQQCKVKDVMSVFDGITFLMDENGKIVKVERGDKNESL